MFPFLPLGEAMHCNSLTIILCSLLLLAWNLSNLILWVTHWKPFALWYWQFQRGHCQQWMPCQEYLTPGMKGFHSPLVPSVPWSCRVTLCTRSTNISICSKLQGIHLHKWLTDLNKIPPPKKNIQNQNTFWLGNVGKWDLSGQVHVGINKHSEFRGSGQKSETCKKLKTTTKKPSRFFVLKISPRKCFLAPTPLQRQKIQNRQFCYRKTSFKKGWCKVQKYEDRMGAFKFSVLIPLPGYTFLHGVLYVCECRGFCVFICVCIGERAPESHGNFW